jgi:hypothetical protein
MPKDYVSQPGMGTLERPRYAPGLLLEDDDLTAAVEYTRNLMRLMFRSLFGCGVICGLQVKARLICNASKIEVSITRGVALDCLGNPIEIPKDLTITYDPQCAPLPDELWVVACYAEKCCQPRDVSCSADDDGHPVATRIMDSFEVRLYDKRPKCVCSCEPPDLAKHSAGGCCDEEDSSDASAETTTAEAQARSEIDSELPPECKCYADHFAGKCDCDCCCPCVLVGNVYLDEDDEKPSISANNDHVRRIRPLLVGYYECVTAASRAASEKARLRSLETPPERRPRRRRR